MPGMPALPDDITSLPTCPIEFLYSVGGLYYYETADCDSGASGFGVSSTLLDEVGVCENGACSTSPIQPLLPMSKLDDRSKSIVEAMLKENGTGGRPVHPFPKSRSKTVIKQLRVELGYMKERNTTPTSGAKDCVSARRKAIAEYFVGTDGVSGQLDAIDSLPRELREAYFNRIYPELRKVRTSTTDPAIVTIDRDLILDTVTEESLAVIGKPKDSTVTLEDVLFTKGGVTTPFVKLSVKRNALPGGAQSQDVFFRIQKAARTTGKTFAHWIGQQISEIDLKWNSATVPTNKIVDAKWLDRHSNFHVIAATPDGGTEQSIFVYSAFDLAAKELFT